MARKLPPFSALKAFEAAARKGSFARAAAELNVTATAVSQHVKGLESWLGEALFMRHANGVELSDKAKALLPEVTRLLDQMASLLPPAMEESHTVSVTISAPRAFADGWLGPRLADFQNDNPGITVFVEAESRTQHHPERNNGADLMIAQAPSASEGLLSELLFEDAIAPVCTEQYRDLMGLTNSPSWKSATLLHDALWEQDWMDWGQSQTISGMDWRSGPRYPNHWLLLEAARQGRGVAIAHLPLAAESLADGSLVSLSDAAVATGQSYYLLRRRGHRAPAAIQLRAWLLGKMRQP
nr:LysR substrate-binding domain-containing protein [uncultured Cohaesibacter sp.]